MGLCPKPRGLALLKMPKKGAKKREAKYKSTFASFFRIFHCLLLSIALCKCQY